jgi:hypothetical protein
LRNDQGKQAWGLLKMKNLLILYIEKALASAPKQKLGDPFKKKVKDQQSGVDDNEKLAYGLKNNKSPWGDK